MPMVSESYSDPAGLIRVNRDSQVYDLVRPSRVVKSQTGFRSGPLSQEEHAGISNQGGTWATAVHQIAGLNEAYEHTSKASRKFMVNDRDYTEVRLNPTTFNYKTVWAPEGTRTFQGVGAVIPQSLAWNIPPAPVTSALQSMAAVMLRQSMPTKVEINLTRFIGELGKDGQHMFNMTAYNPRNLRELGGSYLNMVFGVMPTSSEALKLAEVVVRWDEILSKYVAQEKHSLRRRRSKVLFEETLQGRLPRLYNQNQFTTAGPASLRVSYIVPGLNSGSVSDNLEPSCAWSYTAKQTLDVFGTWEYFIPRPKNLEGRLRRYKQMAQKLLGGGIDASVAYDLTPWSWLLDWLVDVGGLLRYQQAMVDNQVVASKLGYTLNERSVWTMHCTARTYVPFGWTLVRDDMSPCTASASRKRVTRRKGNPFSIMPTWENLSPQQWAIAAALGLSRSRGVATNDW